MEINKIENEKERKKSPNEIKDSSLKILTEVTKL